VADCRSAFAVPTGALYDVLAILSRVTGRPFTYFQVRLDVVRQGMGEDGAKMYEWFDRVGYTVDRAALRREFPDVVFQTSSRGRRHRIGTRFSKAHRTSARPTHSASHE
jgi:hypothetical protein